MHTYHLTIKSANAKTGPIPVSTTSAETCPDTCAMKQTGACYAGLSHLGIHWRAVTSGARGGSIEEFAASVAQLPAGQLWRHNQAGDLPGVNQNIDARALGAIVRANRGRRGFTYTHKPMSSKENRACVRSANKHGFTVNLSADNIPQADALKALNVGPVVTVLPESTRENFKTPAGHTVVICPAVTRDSVTCATCGLCAWSGRDVIIGFPAHGAKRASVTTENVFKVIN